MAIDLNNPAFRRGAEVEQRGAESVRLKKRGHLAEGAAAQEGDVGRITLKDSSEGEPTVKPEVDSEEGSPLE